MCLRKHEEHFLINSFKVPTFELNKSISRVDVLPPCVCDTSTFRFRFECTTCTLAGVFNSDICCCSAPLTSVTCVKTSSNTASDATLKNERGSLWNIHWDACWTETIQCICDTSLCSFFRRNNRLFTTFSDVWSNSIRRKMHLMYKIVGVSLYMKLSCC